MPFHITQEHMSHIARESTRRARTTRQYMDQAKQSLEVIGTAAAFGYLQGWNHNQMPSVMGIEADLGVGVLAHLIAFAELKLPLASNNDLHNIGDGALAAYAVNQAAKWGAKNPRAVTTSATTTTTTTATSGWGPSQMGVGAPRLTPQDVARMQYGF